MKYVIALLLFAGATPAQGPINNYSGEANWGTVNNANAIWTRPNREVASAPSGACPEPNAIVSVQDSAALYKCVSGTWTIIGGGGAGCLDGASVSGNINCSGGSVDLSAVLDFGGNTATRIAKRGLLAARPTACTEGDFYHATDAAASSKVSVCTTTGSPGTWTTFGGGGGVSKSLLPILTCEAGTLTRTIGGGSERNFSSGSCGGGSFARTSAAYSFTVKQASVRLEGTQPASGTLVCALRAEGSNVGTLFTIAAGTGTKNETVTGLNLAVAQNEWYDVNCTNNASATSIEIYGMTLGIEIN